MDVQSTTPPEQLEQRERHVSSEPCATRPNPFNNDESARKRRRTSLSASRSISAESSHRDPLPEGPDPADRPESLSHEAMKIDDDGLGPGPNSASPSSSSTPCTPANSPPDARSSRHGQPPSGAPPSSRVTINLRSGRPSAAVTPAGDSPVSPSRPPRQSILLALPQDSPDDVKVSVEEAEEHAHTRDPESLPSSPSQSSSLSTGEPEIITIHDDDEEDVNDDMGYSDDQPAISIIADAPSDPSYRFPYKDATETQFEALTKIHNYFSGQPLNDDVFARLGHWLLEYINYAKGVGYEATMESLQENRELWFHFPEMVSGLLARKTPVSRSNEMLYMAMMEFLLKFTRITVYLVHLDIETLIRAEREDGPGARVSELWSTQYISRVLTFGRGQFDNALVHDEDSCLDPDGQVLEKIQAGAGILVMSRFLQHLRRVIPISPRLIDSLAPYLRLVCAILRDAQIRAENHLQYSVVGLPEKIKARLAQGLPFCLTARSLFCDVTDKFLSSLGPEAAREQVTYLTEMSRLCYAANPEAAMEAMHLVPEQGPPILAHDVPEVLAFRWRFDIWIKLIRSSQMQLRVVAVTSMCGDLVCYWKRYNEGFQEDPLTRPVLAYFSQYLLRTQFIEYILGPTCHPEIILESYNIIGFLAVTRTYMNEHTDRYWQTVTTTQDHRVSDALIRMMGRVTQLLRAEPLLYICRKLETLPVEGFTASMRELCGGIFRQVSQNRQFSSTSTLDYPPFSICLRLIRESSGPFLVNTDVQIWAVQRFREQLLDDLDFPDTRKAVLRLCLGDIVTTPDTSLGSLWAMHVILRASQYFDLANMESSADIPGIMVLELEHAIRRSTETGSSPVLAGAMNLPRRDIIHHTIMRLSDHITPDLGVRLWTALVGKGASCQQDRDTAWSVLNGGAKRNGLENSFLQACYMDYFPLLEPEFFCSGALEFLLNWVLPQAADETLQALEDPESSGFKGIEQVWRMVLSCPRDTIEAAAIKTLVVDIYVENKALLNSQHERSRTIHRNLVNRCLRQLKSAAQKLKSFNDGTSSGEDEPMVIVATDQQVLEQELMFGGSLALLREFLEVYQTRPEYSAPDLRNLMLETPDEMQGVTAGLKYQSFDGEAATGVLPLDNVGTLNTVASLLASLRDATGFSQYRLFYKGAIFHPSETDVSKSLEDLDIRDAMILVKRVSTPGLLSPLPRPGVSSLEMEVLGHFKELWEYLSMDERFAQEIYQFLVRLPADERMLAAFESPTTEYTAVFELGHPWKCLYAVHVLNNYLEAKKKAAAVDQHQGSVPDAAAMDELTSAAFRALALVVAGFSNPEVIDSCPTTNQRRKLCHYLINCYLKILKVPSVAGSDTATGLLNAVLVDRLVDRSLAFVRQLDEESPLLAARLFDVLLQSHHSSQTFMSAFRSHPRIPILLEHLLLNHPSQAIRQSVMQSILRETGANLFALAEFFWPTLLEFLARSGDMGIQVEEALHLTQRFFALLMEANSPVVDLPNVMVICVDLLLQHNSIECFTKPDTVDKVSRGLVATLALGFKSPRCPPMSEMFPEPVAVQLFWKQLFPRMDRPAPQTVIINSDTRAGLCEIIFKLVQSDPVQYKALVRALRDLTPFCDEPSDEEDHYLYDLLPQFERDKHVRAPCGYVGLKNLSNTCYFNSLFTQLFMNVQFREFMLNVPIDDPAETQELLAQTQKMFGYMQNSLRRFYDPVDCVASIKTYDDGVIDIHNQMDVDEFYNLLFDRWEGQLKTAEDKQAFRSLYGGQLVQQVKSKECEHISERLEPFAAIQCDIKGKGSLEESLQAYVDGEVMEGDNKYKCSSCDRHVDAVKRTCLKQAPDNLIFHLKRFEFNLRTLTRSKINDLFAFPKQIDMRPYTIDHLDDSMESDEKDMFELVGILVHSGTAESGHYYSYIRQRPSSTDQEAWLEFNDDQVSEFDPLLIEPLCFGGPDYRSNYETPGVTYDKSYSAYMLFYQRTSSLKKEQQSLMSVASPEPAKAPMPADLRSYVELENLRLVRRHCLYDPRHSMWATQVINNCRLGADTCSPKHHLETSAIQMGIGHLDQVVSRVKEIPQLVPSVMALRQMCQTCDNCAKAVFNYFNDHPLVFRYMLQRNPDPIVRSETGSLFMLAVERIKVHCPSDYMADSDDMSDSEHSSSTHCAREVIRAVVDIFDVILDIFWHGLSIRAWQEVFGVMVTFARLGRHERAVLLENDYLHRLLCIVMVDPGNESIGQPYQRMYQTLTRRMPARPVSYDNVLNLLNLLIGEIDRTFGEDHIVTGPEGRLEYAARYNTRPIPITEVEHELIRSEWKDNNGNILVDKLGSLSQNPSATDAIVGRLIRSGPTLDGRIGLTLRVNIQGSSPTGGAAPFLRLAAVYCRLSRFPERVAKLIQHVCRQCMRGLVNTEGFAYFTFQQQIFDNERPGTRESLDEIRLQGYANIPHWVPGLLAYYEPITRGYVEEFLNQRVFSFIPDSTVSLDDEDEIRIQSAVHQCARELAHACLDHLNKSHIQQRNLLTRDSMTVIGKVLYNCEPYFHIDGEEDVEGLAAFNNLRTSVMDSLGALTVDEIEEDASEWEQSMGSSDPMDSLADLSMQVVGDDTELQ